MTLTDRYQSLKNHLELLEQDILKANTGNKAAGVRVRKAMQEAKAMCQEIRQAITDQKHHTGA